MQTPPKRNPTSPRNPLHGVITDQQLAELRERNHYRRQAAICELGRKWIGHRARHLHRAQRIAERHQTGVSA